MRPTSNNIKYLITVISLIILFIIGWFLYKHFSKEKYDYIIEKYNDIMQKLLDDKNLDFDKILLYQSNYIDNIHKYKKEYEIAKTIYNEKLANLSSILLDISNQDIVLKDKSRETEESLIKLNQLISAGTDSSVVLKFINEDFIGKYGSLKAEIENRKEYFNKIQDKISIVKEFISNFNEIIKNYNESLKFGEEFKNKISNSEIINSLQELDDFKTYVDSSVKNEGVKNSLFAEVEQLKAKLNSVKSLIESESDNAVRELNPDNEMSIYVENIKKFGDLTENNSDLLNKISNFLTNLKLQTIKNTNELYNNIQILDSSIKDIRELLQSLKTI